MTLPAGPVRVRSDGAVQDTMIRALAVVRGVLLLNTLALGWYRRDTFVHPGVAVVFFAALSVWTAYAVWAYSAERRRRWPLLVADLAVAVGGIVLSAYVIGPDLQSTLPGFWVMAVAPKLASASAASPYCRIKSKDAGRHNADGEYI